MIPVRLTRQTQVIRFESALQDARETPLNLCVDLSLLAWQFFSSMEQFDQIFEEALAGDKSHL